MNAANYKRGFLSAKDTNAPTDQHQQPNPPSSQSYRAPMVFKIDFTIDTAHHLRILELNHFFSGSLCADNLFINLVRKLRTLYSHVYLSGDYYPASELLVPFVNHQILKPEFVPLGDLFDIKTDGTVIIRTFETPTHYTPFCIQQRLRERGSRLAVFGAEPMECLMAFEKILMQRLQMHTGMPYPVPTALVNLSSTEDSYQEVERQLRSQNAPVDTCCFVVKPAFSTTCVPYQFASSTEELRGILQKLKSQYPPNINYKRTAESFTEFLWVGDPGTLKQRLRNMRRFLSQNNLQCLGEVNLPIHEDPFWMVQQVVFSLLQNSGDVSYHPTYRTYIMIEDFENSVKISFIESVVMFSPSVPFDPLKPETTSLLDGGDSKYINLRSFVLPENATRDILRNLNDRQCTRFFNAIFRTDASEIHELIQYFPELSEFYEGMICYPPYQKLLLNIENEETKHYDDLLAIYAIQRHVVEEIGHLFLSLPCILSMIELYDRVSSRRNVFPAEFFLSRIFRLTDDSLYDECVRICHSEDRARLIYSLAHIRLYLHALRSHFPPDAIHKIKSFFKGFINIFFGQFPQIAGLSRAKEESWTTSDCLEFHQLLLRKHTRELIVDYACQLCSLEEILKKNRIKMEKEFLEQKKIFISWSLFYFTIFPIPFSPSDPPPLLSF
jgi:hypothetical protein